MSVRRGFIWSFLEGAGGHILQFATGIVMARLLVPEDFGLVATVQVFTAFAGLVTGGGIVQALVRQKVCTPVDINTAFTVQLLIAIALYLIFYLAIAPASAHWLDDPRYVDLIRVAALGFFVRPFWGTASVILQRHMRFRALALNALWGIVLNSALSIAMALAGLGVWSLILSGLIASVVRSLFLMMTAKWLPRPGMNLQSFHAFYRAGAGFTAINFLDYISEKGTTLVISKMMGPTPLGFYHKGYGLAATPIGITGSALNRPLFRAMAAERENPETVRYLYLKSTTFMATITWPACLLLAWYAEPLIVFLYGEQWRAAAPVLQTLAISASTRAIGRPSRALLLSDTGMRWVTNTVMAGGLTGIAAAMYFSTLGLHAVAAALATVQVGQATLFVVGALRHTNIRLRHLAERLKTPIIGAVCMLMALYIIEIQTDTTTLQEWMRINIQIAVSALTYMMVIYFTPDSLFKKELMIIAAKLTGLRKNPPPRHHEHKNHENEKKKTKQK